MGGRGWARSLIIRPQESLVLYKSLNASGPLPIRKRHFVSLLYDKDRTCVSVGYLLFSAKQNYRDKFATTRIQNFANSQVGKNPRGLNKIYRHSSSTRGWGGGLAAGSLVVSLTDSSVGQLIWRNHLRHRVHILL
jgi:hypothetical protein